MTRAAADRRLSEGFVAGKSPSDRLLSCVVDRPHDAGGVSRRGVTTEYSGKRALRTQLALLVDLPHLGRKLGCKELRREPSEGGPDVVGITFEHGERGIVAGGID